MSLQQPNSLIVDNTNHKIVISVLIWTTVALHKIYNQEYDFDEYDNLDAIDTPHNVPKFMKFLQR